MAESRSKRRNRPRRHPLSIRAYCSHLAGWGGGIWLLLVCWGGAAGFDSLAVNGRLSLLYSVWSAVWTGFFVGFVTAVSNSLQARRNLLMGVIEPTENEWQRLESFRSKGLGSFWGWSVAAATGLALLVGGSLWIAQVFSDPAGIEKLPYLISLGGSATLGAIGLSLWATRRAVYRFVSTIEADRPMRISRIQYVLLHNVIPYALFNATVGLAVAYSRFMHFYRDGKPVPSDSLSTHLGLTVLVITLVVVGAARVKAKLDFLSPIVLVGQSTRPGKRRWKIWFALAAPILTYLALRLSFAALQMESVELRDALRIKLAVCLVFSIFTAWWAVTSALDEMESEGLDGHRYVRLHRFLRRTGFIKTRRWH